MDKCNDCHKPATHKVYVGTEHMSAIGNTPLAPTFYCDDHYHFVCGRMVDVGYVNSTWDGEKNLDDFQIIADALLKEGQTSRAEAMEYLIARCKRAEARPRWWNR